jgi:hypothetical protein
MTDSSLDRLSTGRSSAARKPSAESRLSASSLLADDKHRGDEAKKQPLASDISPSGWPSKSAYCKKEPELARCYLFSLAFTVLRIPRDFPKRYRAHELCPAFRLLFIITIPDASDLSGYTFTRSKQISHRAMSNNVEYCSRAAGGREGDANYDIIR